jgi:hypothetical protein
MLSFSISFWDLIKFPYFADTSKRGDGGQMRPKRQSDFIDNFSLLFISVQCILLEWSHQNWWRLRVKTSRTTVCSPLPSPHAPNLGEKEQIVFQACRQVVCLLVDTHQWCIEGVSSSQNHHVLRERLDMSSHVAAHFLQIFIQETLHVPSTIFQVLKSHLLLTPILWLLLFFLYKTHVSHLLISTTSDYNKNFISEGPRSRSHNQTHILLNPVNSSLLFKENFHPKT